MKSTNNCNFFNNYFLRIAEKLTGANQIDKLSQLKNRAPTHYVHQNCSIPIPILNSGTHQLKR